MLRDYPAYQLLYMLLAQQCTLLAAAMLLAQLLTATAAIAAVAATYPPSPLTRPERASCDSSALGRLYLGLCAVEDLEELCDAVAHARVHVRL